MISVRVAFYCFNTSSVSGICPTWYIYDNETEQCVCHSLKRWIICQERERQALLAYGKCMTYDTGEIYVGRCPYILFSGEHESIICYSMGTGIYGIKLPEYAGAAQGQGLFTFPYIPSNRAITIIYPTSGRLQITNKVHTCS